MRIEIDMCFLLVVTLPYHAFDIMLKQHLGTWQRPQHIFRHIEKITQNDRISMAIAVPDKSGTPTNDNEGPLGSGILVAPGIQAQFVDETLFGVEYEFLEDLKVI